MRPGSTPTITAYIDDVNLLYVKKAEITIKQPNVKIVKEAEIDTENKNVSIQLTQQDTIKLTQGMCELQIKIKFYDDNVAVSNVVKESTDKLLNSEVI